MIVDAALEHSRSDLVSEQSRLSKNYLFEMLYWNLHSVIFQHCLHCLQCISKCRSFFWVFTPTFFHNISQPLCFFNQLWNCWPKRRIFCIPDSLDYLCSKKMWNKLLSRLVAFDVDIRKLKKNPFSLSIQRNESEMVCATLTCVNCDKNRFFQKTFDHWPVFICLPCVNIFDKKNYHMREAAIFWVENRKFP